MRVPSLLPLVVALAVSCGGSPPGAPSGARSFTIVSGETGMPVAGAEVTIGGRVLRTDAAGRVALDGSDRGALDVKASGFLLRESLLTGEDTAAIWPVDSGYTADYVRTLLYTPAYLTREQAPAVATSLSRILAPRVSIVPSEELARDAAAMEAHRVGAASITEATGGAVLFVVERTPFSAVVFRTSLDATASADALTFRDLRGGTVVGGRTVFKAISAARDPGFVAHEMGHALGLQHSTVPTDIMYFYCNDRPSCAFSPSERRTIRLLLQRPPGTQFPDNDRDAGMGLNASSLGPSAAALP